MTVWLDANVVLRFLTAEPAEQARRARRLMKRAADGEIVLRLSGIVIAEVIWVLGSFYERDRAQIADAMRSLVRTEGILVDDADLILEALRAMEDANVAYIDAWIAASARHAGELA